MSRFEGFNPLGSGPTRLRPHGNVRVLKVAVIVLFGVLTAQLARMQIVEGAEYKQRSQENFVRVASILPPRGLIYDRNGTPLVSNVGVFQVSVVPDLLPEEEDQRYLIYLELQQVTSVPALEIKTKVDDQEKVGRGYIAITIQKYLSKEQALQLDELSTSMPGVKLVVTPGRQYIDGTTLSHILGFTGPQDATETDYYHDQGYLLSEFVGKAGVEWAYESDLRGTPGISSNEEDAYGRVINQLQTQDPKPGNSVKLSIDLNLQNYVCALLETNLPAQNPVVEQDAKVAAAVVMNPNTGEIYSLCSIPGYDNNLYTHPEQNAAEIEQLLKDPRHPFLNWALSASAPGSTFKLLTSAAALSEGNITPNTPRNVPSTVLEIKGVDGNIYPLFDWRAHGYLQGLAQGIAWSSNIYFYMASCGIPQEGIKGLGNTYDVEKQAVLLADYAHEFGFGEPTGIDIGGESSGIIPTPEWKKQAHSGPDFHPEDREWYYADTCFMGIGQGDVTATPLQIARLTSAIANNGTLVTPHVAESVIDQDGNVVRTIDAQGTKLSIKPEYFAAIREGMHESVGYGAGVLAQQPGIDIAGKTGTAEFGGYYNGYRQQHAWFTGFAPFDDPQVVVTVYFDLGIGGNKAAPVAGKIIKYFMDNVHE